MMILRALGIELAACSKTHDIFACGMYRLPLSSEGPEPAIRLGLRCGGAIKIALRLGSLGRLRTNLLHHNTEA